MRLRKKRNIVISEINITPFTDIVLVLLIIFIITTPMLMQSGIKVSLPKTQVADNENISNIEVVIVKEGYVYIEGKQIHSSNIEDVVRELVVSHPDKSIVIKGDKDVQYEHIIQFMDKAKKAGTIKFALATSNAV
ncbi:MAG: biopolymer transporter ExbD [Endomicrobium sp.]|jgi:biopolymer transport protein ExbD|nr:biopolymer transporter ExbD [Endomicrobium sp.]